MRVLCENREAHGQGRTRWCYLDFQKVIEKFCPQKFEKKFNCYGKCILTLMNDKRRDGRKVHV